MNVVAHIPHASVTITAAVRSQFVLSDDDLRIELLNMTDHFTDELYRDVLPGVKDIIFPVSRLVVDPERFEDDASEPMTAVGMGVIYERTSDGRPLRRGLSPGERRELLDAWYRPHHDRLTAAVRETRQRGDTCLVLDCHSFPAIAHAYEQNKALERPEICIGADAFHTPDWLTDAAVGLFRSAGFSVAVNEPFAGALVPSAYYRTDERVLAVMVELRRDLYMDEDTGEKRAAFGDVRQRVRDCIATLAARIDADKN